MISIDICKSTGPQNVCNAIGNIIQNSSLTHAHLRAYICMHGYMLRYIDHNVLDTSLSVNTAQCLAYLVSYYDDALPE